MPNFQLIRKISSKSLPHSIRELALNTIKFLNINYAGKSAKISEKSA